MATERIVALRERHRDLQRQDLETDEAVKNAEGNLDPDAVESFETMKSDIESLRGRLQTLLSNRVPSKLENEDVLADANSLLTQIVFKQRALWREMVNRRG